MSPEQMKARVNEIAQEAYRRRAEQTHPGHDIDAPTVVMAVELALSNWTPPDPISPRVRAAREYLKTQGIDAPGVDAGKYDDDTTIPAFLAGFAAAVKLAEPLAEALGTNFNRITHYRAHELAKDYRQSIGDTPHEGQ